MSGALFPRSFSRRYPVAVRGEGVYLWDEEGKKYLDACGGAAVVTIGHGVREVVEALSSQAARLAFAHTTQFHTGPGLELAGILEARLPRSRTWFTSGGSEATETAIKMVRQYWLNRGQPARCKFISRWQSYHGATLGALALSGIERRREPYKPLLPDFVEHIPAPFCAKDLDEAIRRIGPGNVAAFICEPVVGAASGAVPPDGYLRQVRKICDAHEILWIADEILCGAGRTGRYFATEHEGVVPDITLLGKGLASGYAPLAAVLATDRVWRGIPEFSHGYTYQSHPPSLAAGVAVQRYMEKHNLVARAAERGAYLAQRLEPLRSHAAVKDVRGRGLLQTVEFSSALADRISENLRARGVLVYPVDDHIMIAPPYIIEESQIDLLARELDAAISEES